MPSKISRKYSYRGQRVLVELRDGSEVTGTVIGWGPRLMQLHEDATGAYRELSAVNINNVYQA
jgi:hypothetical protein